MAIQTGIRGPGPAAAHEEPPARPPGSIRFDWIFTLAATWLIGGVHLDGWAHNHIPTLETFFTPWHAVLYSGYACVGVVLVVTLLRNRAQGYDLLMALPPGYNASLAGVVVFGVGGVLDMLWHIAFGIEHSIDALLSPTHLTLATGMVLMVTGPLRAAWARLPRTALTWRSGAPAIISLTYALAVFAFFTQFIHPFVDDWASSNNAPKQAKSDLWVMNADGTGQVRLTSTQMNVFAPVWSGNDRFLAFDADPSASTRAGSFQIYIVQANGSSLKQVTSGSADSFHPAWSPDQTALAYTSGTPGSSEIFVINAQGRQRQLTQGPGDHWFPAWSPDGRRIAFSAGTPGNLAIFSVRSDGTGLKQLTPGGSNDVSPTWSPDGRFIAFASEQNGHIAIYEVSANGSGLHRVADTSIPSWAPSYAQYGIAFAQRQGSAQTFNLLPTGNNFAIALRNGGGNGAGTQAFSHSGKKIAYAAAPVNNASTVDYQSEKARGVASILLQAAILMGVLLLLVRRWRPPFGAVTLILALATLLISFMADQFQWIAVAIAAGLIADGIILLARPSPGRPLAFRGFAFAVPVVLYLLYFLGTAIYFGGVWWTIHMWAGVTFMSGVVGVLLSFLALSPQVIEEPVRTSQG